MFAGFEFVSQSAQSSTGFLIPLPTLMSLIVHRDGEAKVDRFRFLSQNVGSDKRNF